jgi:hypothetical protein
VSLELGYLSLIPISTIDPSWYSDLTYAYAHSVILRDDSTGGTSGGVLVETTEPRDDDRGRRMAMRFRLLPSVFSFFPPRGRTGEPAVTTWWFGSDVLASLSMP